VQVCLSRCIFGGTDAILLCVRECMCVSECRWGGAGGAEFEKQIFQMTEFNNFSVKVN